MYGLPALEVCMRRLSASLLFLFTGAFAFAQISPTTFTLQSPDTSGCPVGFSASRRAAGQIMSASDARQAGPGQGLHLTLQHTLPGPAIDSVEIIVYGVSSKARVLPAGPRPEDISKTFELRRSADSSALTEADVWMHQVGSLTSVDLISVTYANGTTWHASANLKCRAIPSNYLLVGRK
jgi:hypothetical protein